MKYADSGVNIDAAQRALARAKASVKSTWDARVRSDLGAFGGLYLPRDGGPLLVSSVDGVGTKVKVATLMQRFDTVGQDIVNHCVDDILVQGAEPLFFMDYFGTGRLEEDVLPAVIDGLCVACRENGCALLAGETAEMPGVYPGGDFDLVGAIVGQVDPDHLIDGSAIRPGDRAWGLPSSGLHTNGYTLARKVLLEKAGLALDDRPAGMEATVGEALLAVHRSYLADVRSLWEAFGRDAVHGLAHITGGGFYDNVPRIIPDGLTAHLDCGAWEAPTIFRLIAEHGEVEAREMYRVFNMGVGMVVFLSAEHDLSQLPALRAVPMGEIREGGGGEVAITLPA